MTEGVRDNLRFVRKTAVCRFVYFLEKRSVRPPGQLRFIKFLNTCDRVSVSDTFLPFTLLNLVRILIQDFFLIKLRIFLHTVHKHE